MCLYLALDLAKLSKTSYHSRITYLSHWNIWTLPLLPRKRIIKQTGILNHIPVTRESYCLQSIWHQLATINFSLFIDSFTLLMLQIGSWCSAATRGLTLNGWWNPTSIRKPRLYWNWEYKVAEKSNGVSKSKLSLGLLKQMCILENYSRAVLLWPQLKLTHTQNVLVSGGVWLSVL